MNIDLVGKAISYLRKRAGYTQRELAERIGVSDKAVSKWERGLGLPDTAIIGKLAILLDTDTDSLLAGDVIHHDKGWGGLLFLEKNTHGIGAGTLIYDKPLIYYLLSYFLLVGIREIKIVCDSNDEKFITSEFCDGGKLGLRLSYWKHIPVKEYSDECKNIMVVFGKSLIYGVDQTRFFQKAMIHRDRITVLSLPKKKAGAPSRIYFDSNKKIVSSEDGEQLRTQYDYHQMPVMFCPKEILQKAGIDVDSLFKRVRPAIIDEQIYTVVLDRGFVEISINTWDDVADASMFVKTVQKACGMQIYCIEEIAWRRGMISDSVLKELGANKAETEYGKYINALRENL